MEAQDVQREFFFDLDYMHVILLRGMKQLSVFRNLSAKTNQTKNLSQTLASGGPWSLFLVGMDRPLNKLSVESKITEI